MMAMHESRQEARHEAMHEGRREDGNPLRKDFRLSAKHGKRQYASTAGGSLTLPRYCWRSCSPAY